MKTGLRQLFLPLLCALTLFAAVLSTYAGADSHPIFFSGVLSPENVSKFIASQKIQNVDDLLSRMPSRLLSSFTLAYRSESIQADCVSKQTPRILLFSPEDDFVMAVTGNLTTPHCGNVEMMGFDQASRRFNFNEYTFASPNTPNAARTSTSSCTSCHGADPRPIWSSYPNWPGFFGNEFPIDGPAGEQPGEFLNLKKNWVNQPVYKRLAWGRMDSMYPYTNTAQSITLRPNFRLGVFLNRENARRLGRVYSETSGFSDYQVPIEMMLLQCSNLDEGFTSKFPNLEKAATAAASIYAMHPGNIFKPDWFSMIKLDSNSQDPDLSDPDFNDGLYRTSELLAGEVMDQIASSDHQFQTDTARASIFKYYEDSDTHEVLPSKQIENEIFPESLTKDLRWIDDKGEALSFFSNIQDYRDHVCSQLEAKFTTLVSVPAKAAEVAKIPYQLPATNRSGSETSAKAFSSCIECHNGSGSAKFLPFADDATLIGALNSSGYAHGTLANEILWRIDQAPSDSRMPYGSTISAEQSPAIHRFIDANRR